MSKYIDLSIREDVQKKNIKTMKNKKIIFPTFAQMKHSQKVPEYIEKKICSIDTNSLDAANLFRINWYNNLEGFESAYSNTPNYIEFPRELTGVNARIVALIGKHFPTGSHKIGSSYSCLVPRIVTGQFNIHNDCAVWPSTGNFCRGGVFNSAIIGCKSISIMPKEMSEERFIWLREMGANIITTPGSESNVKEIYDKVRDIQNNHKGAFVFNQFSDFFNYLWHYEVTGSAMHDLYGIIETDRSKFAGVCLATGSSGVLGSADYVKANFPNVKIAAAEALQCPTLLECGFGSHRIEGVSDRHVPWIHNVRNTDMIIGIDDCDAINIFNLFNSAEGRKFLSENIGISGKFLDQLNFLGISGVSNLLASIKFSKYYELTSDDVVVTVLTDSSELYRSRLFALTNVEAAILFHKSLHGIKTDFIEELTYRTKKRIHNLKYYTWVEQQGFDESELNDQWYDHDTYWGRVHGLGKKIDSEINNFNNLTLT